MDVSLTRSPSGRPMIFWDTRTKHGKLYAMQKELLLIQEHIFSGIKDASNLIEKNLNYHLSQLSVLLDSFERSAKPFPIIMEVLRHRQTSLILRKEMLPVWRDMADKVKGGSDFWRIALANMQARIEDSKAVIDDLDKTNMLVSPAWMFGGDSNDRVFSLDCPITSRLLAEM